MAYREISVDELRYGMYVAQLDRPWTDTPFLFQGFVLRDEKQLETLKKFCKKVRITSYNVCYTKLLRPATAPTTVPSVEEGPPPSYPPSPPS